MRRAVALLVAVAALVVGATEARAGGGDPGPVRAARHTCVTYEGSAGSGTECVVSGQYPGSFVQRSFADPCPYTGPDGVAHDDGDWSYREGVIIAATGWIDGFVQAIDAFVELLPAMIDAAQQNKPFDEVYRVFTRFCEGNRVDVITVAIRDVFFDPAGKWSDVLEASIDYRPWPILETLPDPATSGFKGLVVNSPAHLAIDAPAWHGEKARDQADRGWTLSYVATPVELSFDVDGQHIACVNTPTPRGDSGMFPSVPDGFTDTKFRDPADGPDPRPCTWVPRRAGTFPVTISITYRRAFVAEGFVQPQPNRTFTFTENVDVVELKVVNVKP